MQFRTSILAIALSIAPASLAQERATATGKVVDGAGAPVEHATVMVYEAGVKKGYSLFCPTCYVDCGKRTITDAEGKFTIAGLSPDLLFTILVLKDGFSSVACFVKASAAEILFLPAAWSSLRLLARLRPRL